MKRLLLFVLAFTGCSLGGHYAPEGPHPHVSFAGAIHEGPIELMHAAVSNSRPVSDLTVLTLNLGPTFGPFQVTGGAGFQGTRVWGACDATGHNCEKDWEIGWAAAAGLVYRHDSFRADLRLFSYDNSPVGSNSSLPGPLEAIVLLFGWTP